MKRVIPVLISITVVIIGILVLQSGLFTSSVKSLYYILRGGTPHVEVIRRFGFNCIWYGSVALILLLCCRSKEGSISVNDKIERLLQIVIVLMAVTAYSYMMINLKSAVIDGVRHWWLVDDEMISMRYARNLVNGGGLVWNPGERVEGYTNFLWTIYMAFVHLAPIPLAKTSLAIMITNVLLTVATVPLVMKIMKLLNGGAFESVFAAAAFILNMDVMSCSLDGFEAVPIMFVATLSIYLIIKDARSDRVNPTTFILIPLISLLRADGLVISLILWGLALVVYRDKRKALTYGLIGLALPFLHLAFRMIYYGDILPNTAYLKVMSWDGRLAAGLAYLMRFISHYLFLLILIVIYIIRVRRAEVIYMTAAFFLYFIYIAWVGGDNFVNNRFFLPFIPMLLIFGIRGIRRMGVNAAWSPLFVVLLFLTLPLQTPYTLAKPLQPEECNIGNIEIGLLIRENTPEDCTVGDFWAGSVFYFSGRRGVDLLGKVDRRIARLETTSSGRIPGHNKFDFDYSLAVRQPDLIVANFTLPVDEADMRLRTGGNDAFTGRLYFNDAFQRYYLDNPVDIETWRTIFVRSDSPVMESRNRWRRLE